MTKSEIEARIRELELAQREAPSWGAAVGARHEELKSLKSQLEHMK